MLHDIIFFTWYVFFLGFINKLWCTLLFLRGFCQIILFFEIIFFLLLKSRGVFQVFEIMYGHVLSVCGYKGKKSGRYNVYVFWTSIESIWNVCFLFFKITSVNWCCVFYFTVCTYQFMILNYILKFEMFMGTCVVLNFVRIFWKLQRSRMYVFKIYICFVHICFYSIF